MTPDVRAALEASIKHWTDNVEAQRPQEASTRSSQCALCQHFKDPDGQIDCTECPVMLHTGEESCEYSPYYEANDALQVWSSRPESSAARAKRRKAATAQRDFLKSLLED